MCATSACRASRDADFDATEAACPAVRTGSCKLASIDRSLGAALCRLSSALASARNSRSFEPPDGFRG